MGIDYTILGMYLIGTLVMISAMISIKYIIFNIKLKFADMRYGKRNVGLIFLRTMGNAFSLPEIINIGDNKSEDKNKIQMFSRESFTDGTFFGYPYMFLDTEDTKTSLGLYATVKNKIKGIKTPTHRVAYFKETTELDGNKKYQEVPLKEYNLYKAQCHANGETAYHEVYTGQKDKDGNALYVKTNIPILETLKTSVSVSPYLMKTVIAGTAIAQTVKDFVDKNKYILYLAGGACLAGAIGAFFAYTGNNSISNLCVVEAKKNTDLIINACKPIVNATFGK